LLTALPIHPQPYDGESLTSWISRLAISNVYTIRQLLSEYVGEVDWRSRDLDFIDNDELSVLSAIGRVEGGTTRLWNMVLTPWKDITTQMENPMDLKGWVCTRTTIRYCPICLSEDQTPYLRLLWRLRFLPICTHHGVILHRASTRNANCLVVPRANLPSPTRLVRPFNCSQLRQFSSSMGEVLRSKKLPKDMGWPSTTQEFFTVLLTLVRYFNLYSQRERSWIELLNAHSLPSRPPFDWRENDAVTALLIERALSLVVDWPTNVLCFVRKNEARFKRLCAEYGKHCPKTLSDLIVKKHSATNFRGGSHKASQLCEVRSRHMPEVNSRQERVRDAVQYLLKTDAPVSLRAICRLARVSSQSLNSDASLHRTVEEGKIMFKLKQEADVQSAIKTLHARGLEVSAASVAAYLGRSYRYLKKSPNLLNLILSGKEQTRGSLPAMIMPST
jgi:hypothetical protein